MASILYAFPSLASIVSCDFLSYAFALALIPYAFPALDSLLYTFPVPACIPYSLPMLTFLLYTLPTLASQ